MTPTAKTSLSILGAALLLGIAGDALLRTATWGINAGLWIGILAVCLIAVAYRCNIRLSGGGRWLLFPSLLFAFAYAWRDSIALQLYNLMAVLAALALAASRSTRGQVRIAGLTDYVSGLLQAGWQALFGVMLLLSIDVPWKQISLARQRSGRLVAVGVGLLIAIPLLLVFGGLFIAADAVFEQIVSHLFAWDFEQIMLHTLTIGAWSWPAAGFLRQALQSNGQPTSIARSSSKPSLGIIEIGIVLGALDVLFFAFVLVQFRYLFGGADLVRVTTGLTYAEYARRGFFELVTVAALVLPTLLAAHHLLRKDKPSDVNTFRVLAGALIALLFVIMLSAVTRMRLYQQEFGLTELRLYTTAFMGWLAIVFTWFIWTVLRGRRDRFAFGALMAGFAVLLTLNAINPDDLIVRTNAGRVNTPHAFDTRYVAGLSADAVPALIDALPVMTLEDRCATAQSILNRWSPPADFDWRTWNWSRIQAWWAVNNNYAALKAACP